MLTDALLSTDDKFRLLGKEVQCLHDSLVELQNTVCATNKNVSELGSGISDNQVFRPQDLTALNQICGDYRATLLQSAKLLRRAQRFDSEHGYVVQVIWGSKIESDVDLLQAQLRDHIVKIQAVLEPLKFRFLINIDNALRAINTRVDRNHEDLLRKFDWLGQLVVGRNINVSLATAGLGSYRGLRSELEPLPEIPAEIQAKFKHLRNTTGSDKINSLPILTGLLHTHLQHGTVERQLAACLEQQPLCEQYLNLLKCVWILVTIKASANFLQEDPGSLWRSYVGQLELKVRDQLNRFSDGTPEPGTLHRSLLDEILQLPEADFHIFINNETEKLDGESEDEDLIDLLLLDFRLPTGENVEHRLRVLQSSTSTLRIVDSKIVSAKTPKEKSKDHDVDLTRVQLVPLYAFPTSDPSALILKFRDQGVAGRGLTVSFEKLQDLVKFQHALTGYYVAFDRRNVSIEAYYQKMFSGGSKIHERGRMQIWVPKKLEKAQRGDLIMIALPSVSDGSSQSPFASTVSTSADTKSLSQTTAASSMSGSALPAINRAKTFRTGTGVGHLHDKPDRPIVVFYLEATAYVHTEESRRVSFLVVTLDSNTFVNRQPCACFKPDQKSLDTCFESSIEHRGKGSLDASRYCSTTDLDAWNVAAAGAWQHNDKANHKVETNLKWVRVRFESVKDRQDFAGSRCYQCGGSDENPTNHCSRNHRGVFGKVRLSYRQKLAEYDNRHNLPHVAG